MIILRPLVAAGKMLLILTILLGIAYPLTMTGVAKLLPHRAEGSLIKVDDQVVGSALLGQQVQDRRLFVGRPSMSEASGKTSGGSNLSPKDPALDTAMKEREQELRKANPNAKGALPADALTASASGLDPHISPEFAQWQAPRVAAATGMSTQDVESLIAAHTKRPVLGFIGTHRVNVNELNSAVLARTHR